MPDGSTWARLFRLDDAYLVRFPGYADFTICADGLSCACDPCPDLTDPTRDHLYLNQVRPLALGLQGANVFHGAAVLMADLVSVFLGPSGHGKSTLAAGLARFGHPFLTDDSLMLESSGSGYLVRPSHAGVRLRRDSSQALLPADAPADPAVVYSSKRRHPASDDLPFCDTAQPLRAAYFLGEGRAADVRIEPLAGAEAVAAWVGHSFLLDIADRAVLARHFDRIAELARIVPSFRLDFPRRYEVFEGLRRALLAHAAELDHRDQSR